MQDEEAEDDSNINPDQLNQNRYHDPDNSIYDRDSDDNFEIEDE